MSNPLLSLLDIDYPLIQAPMAGVSTPALAAAVSNAGALGLAGAGRFNRCPGGSDDSRHPPADGPSVQCQSVLPCAAPARRPAGSRLGNNITSPFCPLWQYATGFVKRDLPDIYRSCADAGAASRHLAGGGELHFGLPEGETIQRLRRQGIVTLATATSLQEALLIEQQGIDVVVAQGYEAGGHRGIFAPQAPDAQLSTFTLVQLLRRRLTIPVVAAGGIADGAGIASVMQLGAQGVQLGTAFLLCPESAADAGYRAAIHNSLDGRTVLTSAISGRPARCLANAFCALGRLSGERRAGLSAGV